MRCRPRDRSLEPYTTGEPIVFPARGATKGFNRIAYAAAHVVADPLADIDPWLDAALDWDKTIAFREYLWDLGLGVAEAMDTAQRGMGLDWAGRAGTDPPRARSRQGAAGRADRLRRRHRSSRARSDVGVDDVIRAYEEQIEAIEAMGGQLIVMASRALANAAKGPEDYARVYDRILSQVREPVIIHWLGEMFDPALAGYWGAADHEARDGDLPRDHPRPCRQGRRRQDLAPVEGEGDRDAPPPAGRACACIPATTSTTPS